MHLPAVHGLTEVYDAAVLRHQVVPVARSGPGAPAHACDGHVQLLSETCPDGCPADSIVKERTASPDRRVQLDLSICPR